jgi:site-specific DNA-methyltransferase (adenine-specific)
MSLPADQQPQTGLSLVRSVVDRALVAGHPDAQAPDLLLPHETPFVTETAAGLEFRADTPLDVWAGLVSRLIRSHKKIEFALADAINFGRSYGQRYAQWVHEVGLQRQTLHNIANVGRSIPIEERRPDVAFGHHAEVASLPPKMRETILDLAVEKSWTQKQVRGAAQEARAALKAAERATRPAPPPPPENIRVMLGDATRMPLADACADVLVTSPPYGLKKVYEGGDVEPEMWRDFMAAFCRDAFRVLRTGGRIVLNVPLDTSPEYGSRPLYGQALFAVQKAGFEYRSTIVWHDDQLGKSTARGSPDSASSPYIYFPGEMIILASVGPWGRNAAGRRSTIDHLDWLDWTNGLWEFPGETMPFDDHPAPFPLTLPHRAISLLSFEDDVILDPFCGSGTTLLAARDLGRPAIGLDISPQCIDTSLRRLAGWKETP